MISWAAYPLIRSAPAFQLTTRPSASSMKIGVLADGRHQPAEVLLAPSELALHRPLGGHVVDLDEHVQHLPLEVADRRERGPDDTGRLLARGAGRWCSKEVRSTPNAEMSSSRRSRSSPTPTVSRP